MDTGSRILVIGAGTMGHGIAQQAAMHGFSVALVDQNEAALGKAGLMVREHLDFMRGKNLLSVQDIEKIPARIRYSTDLPAEAAQADFVFEAIFEDIEIKRTVFAELGECARSDVVLASNTSSFDIGALCEVTRNPARVIGAHWFHPPQATPCIELIMAPQTSEQTLYRAQAMAVALGKYPTRCTNAPGFVANRIQFAMAAEACKIVEEGLATPEEVDRIVKSSFGFRLGAFGPFEIADQAGIDVYLSIFEYLHTHLKNPQFAPPALLRAMTKEKRLGLKSGKGFYDYSGDKANTLRRVRDERLFDRLELFQKEHVEEFSPQAPA
ncbi:MAG: 3-hydroxyacyl-CoA dehydrogenase family protein [Desulfovibrionaceae bacterium]|nr:3-hydroxyacyl-CoA dehydrogenase family protein [Desulfovibrionaceae bacterium]